MTALLAHQGGWDEILLTAGLVLALLGASRIRRRTAGRGADPTTPPPGHAADTCAYCGASLAAADTRCPSCGFQGGSIAR